MRQDLLPRLGFLGGGKMATAMIRGLLAAGLATKERLTACDVLPSAREALLNATGITVHETCAPVVADSDVLVLAVKPHDVQAVLEQIQGAWRREQLLVSVAAGVTLKQLTALAPPEARIVRVMPNTPCLVGACAAGYCLGLYATEEDGQIVQRMLGALGRAFLLPEDLLDAVTGLSASGPAFVATVIEALSDGGVRMGLPRDVATTLAAQTVLGTAKMILDASLHPAQVKDMVASPGGTTMAGLHALEKGGVRAALMDAVEMATRRAVELGHG